jgi:hypothetical protein
MSNDQMWLLFFGILIVVYFVPTVIALYRHHSQRVAIAVLNVCLGWTLLGWVGALVWAFTNKPIVVAVIKEPTP